MALVSAGCGGGTHHAVEKNVTGTGYGFAAPASWQVARGGSQVQVAEGKGSAALVSVTRFPLLRRFRPELWAKVVAELDRAAAAVARQQHGSVTASQTATISGRQARRYEIAYEVNGKPLVERIAFVLRGKTEYLLLCRFPRGGPTAPCNTLLESFRLI